MWIPNVRSIALVALGFGIAVCGSPDTSSDNESSVISISTSLQSIAVAQGGLPACTGDNEAQLAHEEGVGFKVCRSGAWQDISISGPPGPIGHGV